MAISNPSLLLLHPRILSFRHPPSPFFLTKKGHAQFPSIARASPPPPSTFPLLCRRLKPITAASAADAGAAFPDGEKKQPPPPPFLQSLFPPLPLAVPVPLSDVIWPAAGAFLAMALMAAVDNFVKPFGLSLTIASFGAVCVTLFVAPQTPPARKYNMLVAHFGCAALGVAALAIFGPGWIARGAALAASIAFMQYTGSFHPPAAGLPLLLIDAPKFQRLQWWYSLFPGVIGCILLLLVQEAVLYLKENCKF